MPFSKSLHLLRQKHSYILFLCYRYYYYYYYTTTTTTTTILYYYYHYYYKSYCTTPEEPAVGKDFSMAASSDLTGPRKK